MPCRSGRRSGPAARQALLEHAGSLDATELATTGRHLVHVVDPDATDRKLERQLARDERGSHRTRFLALTFDGAGGVRVKGRGSAEDGAVLKAALLPLTAPSPAVDDHDGDLTHDPRDHGTRMWDALVAVAQHGLDTDLPPQTQGAPPRLTLTTTLEALRRNLADSAVTGIAGVAGIGVTGDDTELSASRPAAGLRRRAHPRRPRHQGRGPRRRPHPPAGHHRHLDRPDHPRPTLCVPRL